MSHAYDSRFMNYADVSSRTSAQRIAGLLLQALPIRSVLDVGCAKGTWLDVWSELGVGEIQGVDGDYVDRANLVIPAARFRAANLAQALDLGRQFDLVQSLEVAEHIPGESASIFVENLVRHSSGIVLFLRARFRARAANSTSTNSPTTTGAPCLNTTVSKPTIASGHRLPVRCQCHSGTVTTSFSTCTKLRSRACLLRRQPPA